MSPIEYQNPASRSAASNAALPSVILGCISVTLNISYWRGAFDSHDTSFHLLTAYMSFFSSAAGVACGWAAILRSDNRTLAWIGVVLSSFGLISFIGSMIGLFINFTT